MRLLNFKLYSSYAFLFPIPNNDWLSSLCVHRTKWGQILSSDVFYYEGFCRKCCVSQWLAWCHLPLTVRSSWCYCVAKNNQLLLPTTSTLCADFLYVVSSLSFHLLFSWIQVWGMTPRHWGLLLNSIEVRHFLINTPSGPLDVVALIHFGSKPVKYLPNYSRDENCLGFGPWECACCKISVSSRPILTGAAPLRLNTSVLSPFV